MMDKQVKGINTRLTHLTTPTKTIASVVNPPVVRASTLIYQNYQDYLNDDQPYSTDRNYARSGTETNCALESALREFDQYEHTMVVASGMAAVACAVLGTVKMGDHILFYDALYKSSRRFIEEELPRFGISYDFFDNCDLADESSFAKLITPTTKALMFEAPGSNTFELPDIERIVELCHKHNIISIIDNSYGACIGFNPRRYNIDVNCYSITKYVNGHSDLILGTISCSKPHYDQIKKTVLNLAPKASPDDCYLALRGLRTMKLRMEHQYQSSIKIADFLSEHAKCIKVLHPGWPQSADYPLFKKYFEQGNGVFSVILNCNQSELESILNRLQYFSIGLSWGGFESLAMPFNPFNQRKSKDKLLNGSYLRLSIGLEDCNDLLQDLDNALN